MEGGDLHIFSHAMPKEKEDENAKKISSPSHCYIKNYHCGCQISAICQDETSFRALIPSFCLTQF